MNHKFASTSNLSRRFCFTANSHCFPACGPNQQCVRSGTGCFCQTISGKMKCDDDLFAVDPYRSTTRAGAKAGQGRGLPTPVDTLGPPN